jgi:hypothetical protein
MKTLVVGIIAFGLIVWPLIALKAVWADQNAYSARQLLLVPLVISWFIGSILAICGTMISEDKQPLRLLGRILCVGSLLIEAGIAAYLFLRVVDGISRFGVN